MQDRQQSVDTMPALFIAHGDPMNALADNIYTRDWQQLARPMPPPRAILVISAHWCTDGTRICSVARPETIHDFFGFPAELFACRYPAPGAPWLATAITERFDEVAASDDWGLDHGAWCVLMKLFPNADIPTLQLSLDLSRDPRWHYDFAARLGALRDEGILLLGSGNIVHNIPRWRTAAPGDDFGWSDRFDSAIACALETDDIDTLTGYRHLPDAADAAPTPEHYLPFLYIAAARRAGEPLRMSSFEEHTMGSSAMRSIRTG